MHKRSGATQRKLPLVWLVNGALLLWILLHTIPQLRIETKIYPPSSSLPDGSRYFGDMRNGLFHGNGKLVWDNGNIYEGGFDHGEMSGEGEFRLVNGDVLRGTFRDGMINGEGILHSASGGRYRGAFVDGYVHGNGRLEYPDKSYYEGEFEHGYFQGQGTIHYRNGQTFTGTFAQGNLIDGEHRDPYGGVYRGEFKDWAYFGDGELTLANGDVFHGYFEEGMLSSKGRHVIADGSLYEGEFLSSLYHGEGKFQSADGEIYRGAFKYGQYHGEGVRIYQDQSGDLVTQQGKWKHGVFQGESSEADKNYYVGDVLYNQGDLLDQSKSRLVKNDKDVIDLYVLAGAGDGSQDVFLKEINYVTQALNDLYDLGGKITRLVNHVDTQDSEPLFTLTSLADALQGIASVMDVDNDILLLYITSHGSQETGFYINDKRVKLQSLNTQTLSNYLDASSIKWRVVIISACHSGGFIPHLNNENTLVITAARDDRKSFGCSNDSDMTYFGKAFFRHSLIPQRTLEEAFEQAKIIVEKWEDDIGVEQHSEPQMHVGRAIAEHLKRWYQQQGFPVNRPSHNKVLTHDSQANAKQ